MANTLGPAYLRRRIGRALRQRRDELGIKRDEAAKYIGVQPGTMSKIELGKQNIGLGSLRALLAHYAFPAPQVEKLLAECEQANKRGWWMRYGEGIPEWFRDYVGLEADARQILVYQVEPLPELLQTDDYAAEVTRGSRPEATEDDIRQLVEIRRSRRALLTSERTPALHFVINESAIRRLVGSAKVMREQLEYLVRLAEHPKVTVQVLPFSAGAHPGMKGGFSVLRFVDDPEDDFATVYVEIETGGMYPDRRVELDRYTQLHDQLRALALDERESVELLTEVFERL